MTKTFLFDIDHTLYPYSQGLEDWIEGAMETAISNELGVSIEDARAMREDYYKTFGATLTGLLFHHDLNVSNYYQVKGLVPHEVIDRDELGLALIAGATNRMVAMTNASNRHGVRVLKHLGVFDKFDQIYGLDDMGYWGKPFRRSYDLVFEKAEIDPQNTVFFEDSLRNLAYPKSLGMTTILINAHNVPQGEAPEFVDYHVASLGEAMEIAVAL